MTVIVFVIRIVWFVIKWVWSCLWSDECNRISDQMSVIISVIRWQPSPASFLTWHSSGTPLPVHSILEWWKSRKETVRNSTCCSFTNYHQLSVNMSPFSLVIFMHGYRWQDSEESWWWWCLNLWGNFPRLRYRNSLGIQSLRRYKCVTVSSCHCRIGPACSNECWEPVQNLSPSECRVPSSCFRLSSD